MVKTSGQRLWRCVWLWFWVVSRYMIYHDMDPKGLTRIRSIKNAHFFLQILNEQKKVKRTDMLKSSGETPRAKKSVLLMLQVYVCM